MHNKIQPAQIYIAKPINDLGNENNTIDDEVDHTMWICRLGSDVSGLCRSKLGCSGQDS
jgi:hypothetical protein